jgi:hypothetical protein
MLDQYSGGRAQPSHRIVAAAFAGAFGTGGLVQTSLNLFLSGGYFAVLLAVSIRSRGAGDMLRLASFGAAYVLGLLPTLAANAINAGSVLATTYSAVDATPPDFSLSIAREYLADMPGT